MKGLGCFKFANGDSYEGDIYDAMKHGKGTYYYNNGGRYEGFW